MPPLLGLIEGMYEHVAVHGVFRLVCGIEVHASLYHEKCKLAVLLKLKVLKGGLLEEEGDQDGCALDLVGNTRHVPG